MECAEVIADCMNGGTRIDNNTDCDCSGATHDRNAATKLCDVEPVTRGILPEGVPAEGAIAESQAGAVCAAFGMNYRSVRRRSFFCTTGTPPGNGDGATALRHFAVMRDCFRQRKTITGAGASLECGAQCPDGQVVRANECVVGEYSQCDEFPAPCSGGQTCSDSSVSTTETAEQLCTDPVTPSRTVGVSAESPDWGVVIASWVGGGGFVEEGGSGSAPVTENIYFTALPSADGYYVSGWTGACAASANPAGATTGSAEESVATSQTCVVSAGADDIVAGAVFACAGGYVETRRRDQAPACELIGADSCRAAANPAYLNLDGDDCVVQCPAGQSAVSGQCQLCPAGTYQPLGDWRCLACVGGATGDGNGNSVVLGATSCDLCLNGADVNSDFQACDCATTNVLNSVGAPGWTGRLCDVDVDECASSETHNCTADEECNNIDNDFYCDCPDGDVRTPTGDVCVAVSDLTAANLCEEAGWSLSDDGTECLIKFEDGAGNESDSCALSDCGTVFSIPHVVFPSATSGGGSERRFVHSCSGGDEPSGANDAGQTECCAPPTVDHDSDLSSGCQVTAEICAEFGSNVVPDTSTTPPTSCTCGNGFADPDPDDSTLECLPATLTCPDNAEVSGSECACTSGFADPDAGTGSDNGSLECVAVIADCLNSGRLIDNNTDCDCSTSTTHSRNAGTKLCTVERAPSTRAVTIGDSVNGDVVLTVNDAAVSGADLLTVPVGAELVFSAVPAGAGYYVSGWTGACASDAANGATGGDLAPGATTTCAVSAGSSDVQVGATFAAVADCATPNRDRVNATTCGGCASPRYYDGAACADALFDASTFRTDCTNAGSDFSEVLWQNLAGEYIEVGFICDNIGGDANADCYLVTHPDFSADADSLDGKDFNSYSLSDSENCVAKFGGDCVSPQVRAVSGNRLEGCTTTNASCQLVDANSESDNSGGCTCTIGGTFNPNSNSGCNPPAGTRAVSVLVSDNGVVVATVSGAEVSESQATPSPVTEAVTFVATPDSDYYVSGWTGDCASDATPTPTTGTGSSDAGGVSQTCVVSAGDSDVEAGAVFSPVDCAGLNRAAVSGSDLCGECLRGHSDAGGDPDVGACVSGSVGVGADACEDAGWRTEEGRQYCNIWTQAVGQADIDLYCHFAEANPAAANAAIGFLYGIASAACGDVFGSPPVFHAFSATAAGNAGNPVLYCSADGALLSADGARCVSECPGAQVSDGGTIPQCSCASGLVTADGLDCAASCSEGETAEDGRCGCNADRELRGGSCVCAESGAVGTSAGVCVPADAAADANLCEDAGWLSYRVRTERFGSLSGCAIPLADAQGDPEDVTNCSVGAATGYLPSCADVFGDPPAFPTFADVITGAGARAIVYNCPAGTVRKTRGEGAYAVCETATRTVSVLVSDDGVVVATAGGSEVSEGGSAESAVTVPVTFTATPEAGFYVTVWTGDCLNNASAETGEGDATGGVPKTCVVDAGNADISAGAVFAEFADCAGLNRTREDAGTCGVCADGYEDQDATGGFNCVALDCDDFGGTVDGNACDCSTANGFGGSYCNTCAADKYRTSREGTTRCEAPDSGDTATGVMICSTAQDSSGVGLNLVLNSAGDACVSQCPAGQQNDSGQCAACGAGTYNGTAGGTCESCAGITRNADEVAVDSGAVSCGFCVNGSRTTNPDANSCTCDGDWTGTLCDVTPAACPDNASRADMDSKCVCDATHRVSGSSPAQSGTNVVCEEKTRVVAVTGSADGAVVATVSGSEVVEGGSAESPVTVPVTFVATPDAGHYVESWTGVCMDAGGTGETDAAGAVQVCVIAGSGDASRVEAGAEFSDIMDCAGMNRTQTNATVCGGCAGDYEDTDPGEGVTCGCPAGQQQGLSGVCEMCGVGTYNGTAGRTCESCAGITRNADGDAVGSGATVCAMCENGGSRTDVNTNTCACVGDYSGDLCGSRADCPENSSRDSSLGHAAQCVCDDNYVPRSDGAQSGTGVACELDERMVEVLASSGGAVVATVSGSEVVEGGSAESAVTVPVTFVATPDAGFYVMMWTGDCNGNPSAGTGEGDASGGLPKSCVVDAGGSDISAGAVFAEVRNCGNENRKEAVGVLTCGTCSDNYQETGGVGSGGACSFCAVANSGSTGGAVCSCNSDYADPDNASPTLGNPVEECAAILQASACQNGGSLTANNTACSCDAGRGFTGARCDECASPNVRTTTDGGTTIKCEAPTSQEVCGRAVGGALEFRGGRCVSQCGVGQERDSVSGSCAACGAGTYNGTAGGTCGSCAGITRNAGGDAVDSGAVSCGFCVNGSRTTNPDANSCTCAGDWTGTLCDVIPAACPDNASRANDNAKCECNPGYGVSGSSPAQSGTNVVCELNSRAVVINQPDAADGMITLMVNGAGVAAEDLGAVVSDATLVFGAVPADNDHYVLSWSGDCATPGATGETLAGGATTECRIEPGTTEVTVGATFGDVVNCNDDSDVNNDRNRVNMNATECGGCVAGHATADADDADNGAVSCLPVVSHCPAGEELSGNGTACAACGSNEYNPTPGGTDCVVCDNGTRMSATVCECDSGYAKGASGECVVASPRAEMVGVVAASLVASPEGNYFVREWVGVTCSNDDNAKGDAGDPGAVKVCELSSATSAAATVGVVYSYSRMATLGTVPADGTGGTVYATVAAAVPEELSDGDRVSSREFVFIVAVPAAGWRVASWGEVGGVCKDAPTSQDENDTGAKVCVIRPGDEDLNVGVTFESSQ